ncbi:MAG: hypothetical protein IIX96_00035 [Clostridia bacterium]|nr:hypothetical protein [Clostridia bacterium]
MKKILAMLLVLGTMFLFASCGPENPTTEPSDPMDNLGEDGGIQTPILPVG